MYSEDYLTLCEIAKDFGVSVQYISFEMRQAGYSFPHLPQYGYKDPRCRKKELFEAIIKECATFTEVMETLGLTQSAVRGWMKYHGLNRELFVPYRGAKSKMWKGGYFKDNKGYVWVNCEEIKYFELNPNWKNRAVMVHKVVIEAMILGGIVLHLPYVVHHLDMDRSNNTKENLAILNLAQHKSIHLLLKKNEQKFQNAKISGQEYIDTKNELTRKAQDLSFRNILTIKEAHACTQFITEADLVRG
jgi:hypothetical protein